jgi:microcystin-dependent protein
MQPYIGQIFLVGFNFAPQGFALCDGSLLSITQNQTLFALIGTTYGGDGRTTFGLPDLRSRVPVGFSNTAVPGVTPYALGTKSGSETVTLTVNQIPAHTHTTVVTLPASAKPGTSQSPANLVPAVSNDPIAGGTSNTYGASDNVTKMAPSGAFASSATGSGQPVSIREPFQALNYIIATAGIFPSRP